MPSISRLIQNIVVLSLVAPTLYGDGAPATRRAFNVYAWNLRDPGNWVELNPAIVIARVRSWTVLPQSIPGTVNSPPIEYGKVKLDLVEAIRGKIPAEIDLGYRVPKSHEAYISDGGQDWIWPDDCISSGKLLVLVIVPAGMTDEMRQMDTSRPTIITDDSSAAEIIFDPPDPNGAACFVAEIKDEHGPMIQAFRQLSRLMNHYKQPSELFDLKNVEEDTKDLLIRAYVKSRLASIFGDQAATRPSAHK